jgi:hypothetical protein
MPHARLMAVVRELHQAGYQKLYLYSWPKPSGLHWRWHLFTGPRDWMQRSWREGWYGSGADYNVNPVMGWGDSPGATTEELIHALARSTRKGWRRRWGAMKTTPRGLPCAMRCCPAICTAWTCSVPTAVR